MAQSAATAEYTDWTSAEGWNSPNKCPVYDTKKSDVEAAVMLELWRRWGIPSLPLFPGPQCLGVVATDKVLSIGQL